MKISKIFKQFSRDIKVAIISGLIVSCFSVYAAGTCIIAATADDVTYNNTTVQDAIDELYSMTESYCPEGFNCTEKKYVTDCSNNKVYSTIPNNLSGLAKIMAENAYLDSGISEYVTTCSGVKFNAISSDTNGKGVYEIASTKNDTYPIYYYRGAVTNNNVKFAGFCWKVVRTTNTGGVKLIYNGEPDQDGYCSNTTGTNTQIASSAIRFNSSYNSPSFIGYMYGTLYRTFSKTASELNTSYVYGKDVTYSGGTYTLTNTMTSTGTWTSDYRTLNSNHYTCFTNGTTCTSVYYVHSATTSYAYYITLENGKKVNDVLDEMLNENNINTTNSTIKELIDTWYNSNLLSYTNYIEDTIYCSDRNINSLGGWNPDGGSVWTTLQVKAYNRLNAGNPSLACSRSQDRFTVSSTNGNGALTYPVGLITSDEVIYAGGKENTDNNSYYLYTNRTYWTISPGAYQDNKSYNILVYSTGSIKNMNATGDVRPAISIKPTTIVQYGDGTSTNPYVIQTS